MGVRDDRLDLAHALSLVLRAALAAEEPVLRDHGLQMWDYAVLGALEHGPAPTQSELATAVRRDKTRLLPILDRLESGASCTGAWTPTTAATGWWS